MSTIKTIGNVTHSRTSEFQKAFFLNDAAIAYEVLDSVLDSGWYPENTTDAWTDIAIIDDKYYAAFGEDAVTVQDAALIYIQIEPTPLMVKENEYFKRY